MSEDVKQPKQEETIVVEQSGPDEFKVVRTITGVMTGAQLKAVSADLDKALEQTKAQIEAIPKQVSDRTLALTMELAVYERRSAVFKPVADSIVKIEVPKVEVEGPAALAPEAGS